MGGNDAYGLAHVTRKLNPHDSVLTGICQLALQMQPHWMPCASIFDMSYLRADHSGLLLIDTTYCLPGPSVHELGVRGIAQFG
jgi:hypothetical protein